MPVGSENQIFPRGVVIGCPGHGTETRQLFFVRTVDVHGPDFGDGAVGGETPPAEAFSIRRKEGTAVVTGSRGQSSQAAAVGAHQIDVVEIGRIDGKIFLLFVG